MTSAASAISLNEPERLEFEAATSFSYAEVAALPELQRRQAAWAEIDPARCDICGATDASAQYAFKQLSGVEGFLLALARRRFHRRGGEGNCMEETQKKATLTAKLPDRIAAIAGKTYEVMGDSFELADDEAWARVIALLYDIDPTLIERNKNKRLSRR